MELPIDMVCVCSADGGITPLRFRIFRAEQLPQTAAVTQVISSKPICYVGMECIEYLCNARLGEHEQPFLLRYALRTHSWFLVEEAPPPKRAYFPF